MTRLALKVLGGLAVLLLLVVIVGEMQRAFARSERLADCQSIAGGELGRQKGERCPAPVVDQLKAAAEAQACVSRIGRLDADPQRWAAPVGCDARIHELTAAQNVAIDAVADRDREIAQLRSGQSAAIARAQARGASQARSYANAQSAIDAAPRDPSGLVVCDADCMRQLAGGRPAVGSAAGPRDPR
ncbi:hypothetical protein [Brevundimonas bacteroides]|uniref:hypothetical protein n=1 Tax=Brevundimonas bacteroides TaxID=74311 RepID=UPI0004978B95|nr:hypothetical protein [Brevundimonas bacteroides]